MSSLCVHMNATFPLLQNAHAATISEAVEPETSSDSANDAKDPKV